jgi:hypothetical protein
MRYAQGTQVSSAASRNEIEKTLVRFGAEQFVYGWKEDAAVVEFMARNRRIRFTLPLPDKTDDRFILRQRYGRMVRNAPELIEKLWEQECRERWRALAALIKAKLAGVEAGINLFEQEFLAHIVLPSRETFGSWAAKQLPAIYSSGKMPPLLPGSTEES